MTLPTLQKYIVFTFAACMAALVITGLLSIWDLIAEKYYEKSMWSILIVSIGMLTTMIAAKIAEIRELVRPK
jgi:hypothetical protein